MQLTQSAQEAAATLVKEYGSLMSSDFAVQNEHSEPIEQKSYLDGDAAAAFWPQRRNQEKTFAKRGGEWEF